MRRRCTLDAAVHLRFAAQARRRPDATAVEDGLARLTYRALERDANRLGNRLIRAGAGPERVVAIAVERSPHLVVALLGVLKSGAAYLPVDPGVPLARRAALLSRSGAIALVAGPALAAEHAAAELPVIVLDADALTDESEQAPARPIDPDQLAYVIYTSGSTGDPKGVMVSHAALANHGAAMAETLGLRPSDRVLQFASIAFDVAAEEIYPALATGATVVLRPEPVPAPDAALLRWLGDARISVVNLPASYWHAWTAELMRSSASLEIPATLRAVVVGNEAVQPARLAEWRSRVCGPAWLNAYGPTEATITSTVYRPDPRDIEISDPTDPSDPTVPIGRAIANVVIHVLDGALQPVAPGAPGELFLGGAGLARGYLGAPGLTAERFIPDPFGGPGARLYRTGDRVYMRGDDLVFMGRTDDQVKLRGHRVELGEIAAALRAHPEVADGAAVVREDAPGVHRLIAYAVPRAALDAGAGPIALRRFLEDRLPSYMVPSSVVMVGALPRGPGGKLDRAALPVPAPELATSYAPPIGPVARELAAIWGALLGVALVGADDSFFELGGNSLIALQIASRVRVRFGVALSPRDLLDAPTVAAQAARIEQLTGEGATPDDPDPGPRPAPHTGPVPLSYSQERVWFENLLTPGSVAYNTSFALVFDGALSAAVVERSFAELVRRHEILRTTFHVEDGQPFQCVHPTCAIPILRIDLRHLGAAAGDAELVRRRDEQLAQPFDVSVLPLVRCELLQLAAGRHAMLWTEHHFLHDGWSMALLLREFTALYTAFVQNLPSPLLEPVLQFSDYVVWQRERVAGERLTAGLAFWTRTLAGAPPRLSLPTDRTRPRVRTFAGHEVHSELPAELSGALRTFASAERATLFMAMLAAFLVLLRRTTGQDDLVVGTGVAGRQHVEFEGVIGMMVNSLALRLDTSGDPTFRTLLRRVRDVTLDAYAWQDIPFHKVVAAVRPPRDLGCNPIFQVDFSFHDSAMPAFDIPGARGRLVYTPFRASKFDLSVTVVPGSDGDPVLVMWQYSTDLFDEASIRKLMASYKEVVRDALVNPDRRIGELPTMPDAQLPAHMMTARTPAPATPRDDIELAVWAAFAEVFDATDVGLRDSFFERGGTSIMSARVVHRLRQTTEMRLVTTAVFHHDTIEELAEHIRTSISSASSARPMLVPVQLRGTRPPVFCVTGPSGEALRLRALAHRLGDDQPLYGIAVPGAAAVDVDGLAATASAILQYVLPIGSFTLASHSHGELVARAIADQLSQAGRDVRAVSLATDPDQLDDATALAEVAQLAIPNERRID